MATKKVKKTRFDRDAIWEGVKEIARLAFLAAVAGVVAFVQQKLGGEVSPEQLIIYTAVLRFLDKFVHESKNIEADGIAPF